MPPDLPRLVTIFADQTYHHHDLDAWMAEPRVGWRLAVQDASGGNEGLDAAGETLGDREHERLAWSVPQTQQGR